MIIAGDVSIHYSDGLRCDYRAGGPVRQQRGAQRKPEGNHLSQIAAMTGARATQKLVRIQAELGARLSFRGQPDL